MCIRDSLEKELGNGMPQQIKTACPWYKPNKNVTQRKPDFFSHQTDKWLVFPHELKGLTLKEIIENKKIISKTIVAHKI